MKKLVLLASAAFIVASMTSCKKTQTCVCTSTYGGVSTSSTYTATMKTKDAKVWCEGNSGSSAGYSYSCVLK